MAQFQTYYFEEGNAARRIEQAALPTREDRQRELREQRELEKRQRIRAHRKAKRRSRRVTIFVALGAACIGAYFVSYVHIQNKITTSMSSINRLERQISDLKTENAAAKSRISTTANLSEIQKTAIKELGMVYANSDQIVYYTVDDQDYMSQYEAIEK